MFIPSVELSGSLWGRGQIGKKNIKIMRCARVAKKPLNRVKISHLRLWVFWNKSRSRNAQQTDLGEIQMSMGMGVDKCLTVVSRPVLSMPQNRHNFPQYHIALFAWWGNSALHLLPLSYLCLSSTYKQISHRIRTSRPLSLESSSCIRACWCFQRLIKRTFQSKHHMPIRRTHSISLLKNY